MKSNFIHSKSAQDAPTLPGVVRGKVGDILVQGETGAQIIVDAELLEHFEMALTQVSVLAQAGAMIIQRCW